MKKVFAIVISSATFLFGSGQNKTSSMEPNGYQQIDVIFPKGDKITNNNFQGNVWLYPMVKSDNFNQTEVGSVTFAPGARTNWHSHPGGQTLLVIGGIGYYQEKGGPKRIIKKGDVISCPPNIAHWHGASNESEFIQIAVTSRQNGPTVWLGPVTNEEYNSKIIPGGK